jgi:hypothetical protein
MQPHGSQSRHKDLLPKFAAALDLFLPEVKFAGEGLKTSATLRSSDGHTNTSFNIPGVAKNRASASL